MRVLHVTPSFFPAIRYGGPIVSVLRLCQELQEAGVEIDVATTNANGPENLPVDTSDWNVVSGVRVRYFDRSIRSKYCLSKDLARFLHTDAGRYDLIHITSCFSFPALAAGHFSRAAETKYLVSPRGSLQQWSLEQKQWKKWPYWHLLERRHLAHASALHATAKPEANDILRVLPGANVIVVPNGVDVPSIPQVPRYPNRIVFLGRLHKVKGLDVLADAIRMLSVKRPNLEVMVAGPDDTGERARIEGLLQQMKPRPRFQWLGSVEGAVKYELLASAQAFIMPSHSESFGQAVVEALACGTPAVVSRGCPWQSIEECGAGYWVHNTPEEVALGIERILSAGNEYGKMQEAARRLAGEFAWRVQAERMASHYKLLVQGNYDSGRS
jgi:glycosyltransferase involved in cell wall biosynthesis